MPRPYSQDLRERIVRACNEMGLTQVEAAEAFNVGEATVKRWLRRVRKTGTVKALPMGGTRKPLISDAQLPLVARLVEAEPDATLDELAARFEGEAGFRPSRATMGRAVRRAGFTRKKSRLSRRKPTAPGSLTPGRSG